MGFTVGSKETAEIVSSSGIFNLQYSIAKYKYLPSLIAKEYFFYSKPFLQDNRVSFDRGRPGDERYVYS